MGVIPLLVLPFFSFSIEWMFLLTYLLAYPPFMLFMERSTQNLNRNRGLLLLLHFLVIGILSSPWAELQFNGGTGMLGAFVEDVLVPGRDITRGELVQAQTLLFGLLMVLNEANIFLRYLLQVMGLESLGTKGEEVDQQEYSTGRLIGLLERIFVFLFVLLNQFTAIGFILAAKGVARFQDFKSRTFAEYVLIGTLLSALLAMTVAFIVQFALVP